MNKQGKEEIEVDGCLFRRLGLKIQWRVPEKGKNRGQKTEDRGQKAEEKTILSKWMDWRIYVDAAVMEGDWKRLLAGELEVNPEHAEEKAIRISPKDTLEMKTAAMWALGHYMGAKASAQLSVMRVLACGLQLWKGKEALDHGEFMAWCKKYFPSIAHSSVLRYMCLYMHIKKSVDPHGLTKFGYLDVAPATLTEEYGATVWPRFAKLIEGKTITELYQEFGIIKPRAVMGQEAADRAKRIFGATQDKDERQLMFAREFWDNALNDFVQFEKFVVETKMALPREFVDDATAQLKTILEKVSGAKVELVYSK